MPFNWLKDFHRESEKADDYTEKTLANYARGMRAGGSIRGVRIHTGEGCCQQALDLPGGAEYLPEQAPQLPLPGCSRGKACRCVYRPVMAYERDVNQE